LRLQLRETAMIDIQIDELAGKALGGDRKL
jgi:hypothetical protein